LTERFPILQGYEGNWLAEWFLKNKAEYSNREFRRKLTKSKEAQKGLHGEKEDKDTNDIDDDEEFSSNWYIMISNHLSD
jgi:hypothetical protein